MIRAAIDTSTLTLALALERAGTVVSNHTIHRRKGHSRVLAPAFREMLSHADVELDDVEELIIGVGPGSFTGLRIGLAFARGLSFSTGVPLRAAYSFAGFAAGMPPGYRVACAIDARKREVYGGIWTTGPAARRILPESTWQPERFARECSQHTERLLLAGNGFERYQGAFGDMLARHGTIPFERMTPSAAALLRWTPYPVASGRVEPLYIRPSEAELGRTAR